MSARARRVVLVLVAASLVAIVVLPIAVDQPFGEQTPGRISLAFVLRRWSPIVTACGVATVVALAGSLWSRTRPIGRAWLTAVVAISIACAWAASQNPFEWMFNALADVSFERADKVSFVRDDDIVLAADVDGDRAAYPIRQLAYHHVVNDRIGRTPAVVTY